MEYKYSYKVKDLKEYIKYIEKNFNFNEKYFIRGVDIVSIISENKDGRKYWNKLKQRLKDEGNETVTNCHQLKLKAQDGKYRMTNVVDIEGMFRIIELIPSRNAEPIK